MKRAIIAQKYARVMSAGLALALVLGCESIALMPRPSVEAPNAVTTVTATVNGIDSQVREIYLRTANNQHYVVNYTAGTRVMDRGRSSAIDNLRVGDQVRVEVREGTGRRLFADEILLEGPAAGASATRTVQGTVERVLPERGFLELRAANGRLLTIYLPESSSAETRNRFNRIREGDVVRLEGERLDEDRIELIAFL